MKKVYLIFAALTSVALFSCTGDELAENAPVTNPEVEKPIVFSSLNKGMTRADYTGKDAATLLGNKFVVTGYKGPNSLWGANSIITMDNYQVVYQENTAHTTESNVANWEYVGVDRIKHAIDKGITRQTIKYWDYSAPQYDFIAWSTGSKTAIYEGTPAAGEVLVSAITPSTATTSAYTFTGTAADLSECYIADLVTVKKSKTNYNDPVTLKFRQLGTKVRIAIYETIPGYSVRDVKFYTQGGVLTDPTTEIVEDATIFSAGADIYKEGKYTVTFPSVDGTTTDNNKAHVAFEAKSGATQATTVDWGKLNYTIAEDGETTPGNVYLGRSSNTASYAGDPEKNYYVIYLPNETGANLNLRVDFTLESIDGGGETIKVKNAKAQVPSIYTQWKPGFAYTYLFKISDKTNGRTGVYDPTQSDDATVNSDPAGLYPITFDAVVENAEDNDKTQETITTVMTPSITTYQQQSTVVNADEYTANGKNIFVTVNEGDDIVALKKANGTTPETYDTKAALYTILAGKTEAEVVDALQMQDDDATSGTIKGRSGLVLTEATHTLTNTVEFGANGNAIEISATNGEQKALRFTPTAATTYAFVYTKKAATDANDKVNYQAVAFSDATVPTKYRYDYKAPAATDAQKGVNYFSRTGSGTAADPYVYTMIAKPFIGQGVGNLYLDATGSTIASGYAVTGTTYYYTTDHGMTYKAAHNVAYADFATGTASAADLYTFDGSSYTAKDPSKTDPTQFNGVALYQRTGTGDSSDPYVYTYCVILPQQTTGWSELDTNTYVKATETAEVVGQTYFDKYTKNDGEYYVKVIKVQ